jgi:hypothetical protein
MDNNQNALHSSDWSAEIQQQKDLIFPNICGKIYDLGLIKKQPRDRLDSIKPELVISGIQWYELRRLDRISLTRAKVICFKQGYIISKIYGLISYVEQITYLCFKARELQYTNDMRTIF